MKYVLRQPITARRAQSLSTVMLLLAVAAVVAIATFVVLVSGRGADDDAAIQTSHATRGTFVFSVTETGEVESSRNVEVRCEVKSPGSSGTTILEIVPEGTRVRPGDFLCRLDSSALELNLNAQQIVVHSSQAALIQAETTFATAKIAKTEYLDGAFKQEELTIKGEILVAEEALRRAKDYLRYSERLASKGYVTQLQLEADRFSVEKAQQDLIAAESKLRVLREFTKAKMLTQLESDIQSSHAAWQSAKSNYDLDKGKLKENGEQIARCTITAPAGGQVKYANVHGHRGGGDVIVEPGTPVREGQVIIRLPDPSKMQVASQIAEGNTKFVRAGMPTTIKIRSATGDVLRGKVSSVNAYPEPGGWFSTSVKKYGTTIEIIDNPGGLKPGLTAEVKIEVDSRDDVLQVSLQSVLQHGNDYYCIVKTLDGWDRRQVQVGLNNDKALEITAGLQEGDEVINNPRRHRELVQWPLVSSSPKKKSTESQREDSFDRAGQPDGGDTSAPRKGRAGKVRP
ncbi:MAG: HlyD family efflux transporter periplasmic adaptor subunit [Pirellulales bacterium]